MKLNLIKSAVFESSTAKQHDSQIVKTIVRELGKQSAYRIFEAYDIKPDDYSKWLDVIIGYASDEGIKLNNKSSFFDVAFAVLENDPANIDYSLQEAIVNKLWIDYKASKQQSKIDKLHKVAREEEQLSYAIRKMKKNRSFEDEQFLSGAGMEEEYQSDWDIDKEYDENGDEYQDHDYDENGDDYNDDEDDEDDIPFTGDEESDDLIRRQGREIEKSKDLEDFDSSEREFTSKHRDEIERPRKSSRFEENEEQCPFKEGTLVHYKKDGNNYKVAIEDGPGETIGLKFNGRIKLVPIKDVECIKSEENEESFTRSHKSNKISLLHDVLTGEKSREHLTKLQKQIEDEGANIFVSHHAKAPRNPHPAGSFAYKSWQKGFDSAAKETWAPKPVKVEVKKTKPKKK